VWPWALGKLFLVNVGAWTLQVWFFQKLALAEARGHGCVEFDPVSVFYKGVEVFFLCLSISGNWDCYKKETRFPVCIFHGLHDDDYRVIREQVL
jgi:hypothetical protein